ncbi:MAG: proline dehydrogenase family protein [Bacteroidetes bacterium]|nr:proline dehydrogenase family protein [Bacteroidota bacterium]
MNLFSKAFASTIPIFPKRFIRIFANKYIAGDKLSDGVKTVQELNKKNMIATMDVLGESIKDKKEAEQSKNESIEVLDAISKYKLNSNLSVKLTMLGLNLDYDFCLSLFTEIMQHAKELNNFVRIDMEDSSVTDSTLRIFEDSKKNFDNVGIVIQAYLRRSEYDVLKLTEMKANFRLCKGIYIEPEAIAFKKRNEIRNNFLKLIRLILEKKSYCGIATHDDFVIDGSRKLISELGLNKEDYEFQMLLGVRENLRDKLVIEGHKMKIYVPFGERWYEYSIRRFKENPNLAGQVLKSIFTRN